MTGKTMREMREGRESTGNRRQTGEETVRTRLTCSTKVNRVQQGCRG